MTQTKLSWGLFWGWSDSPVFGCVCHWYNHERYANLYYFASSIILNASIYPCAILSGIPATPNRDFQWVKVKESKLQLCKRIFQMTQFFHHHQIDLAQRDGLKINSTQITPESLLLILIADYAENYTHLAQVPYSLTTNTYLFRIINHSFLIYS